MAAYYKLYYCIQIPSPRSLFANVPVCVTTLLLTPSTSPFILVIVTTLVAHTLLEYGKSWAVLGTVLDQGVTGSLPQRLLLVESYVPVLKQEPMYRWMWYGFYIIP